MSIVCRIFDPIRATDFRRKRRRPISAAATVPAVRVDTGDVIDGGEHTVLIWGWGRTSRQRRLSDTESLLATFRYFSLFFVFTATWGTRYVLARVQPHGTTGYRDLTDDQAMTAAAAGGELPAPSPWHRFSLSGVLATMLVVVILRATLG